MSAVADHAGVRGRYPVIADSLQLAASAQLRNMATLGGNVLQKTRCSYYRDPAWLTCNKRIPGSGCAAIQGFNRNHAILGVDETCIAQYPGDFAVALIALDAQVELTGPHGPVAFRSAPCIGPWAASPTLKQRSIQVRSLLVFGCRQPVGRVGPRISKYGIVPPTSSRLPPLR